MEINKILKELTGLVCTDDTEAFRTKAQDLVNCMEAKINNPSFQAEYPLIKTVLAALSDRQLSHLRDIRDAIKPALPDTPTGYHVGLATWTVN